MSAISATALISSPFLDVPGDALVLELDLAEVCCGLDSPVALDLLPPRLACTPLYSRNASSSITNTVLRTAIINAQKRVTDKESGKYYSNSGANDVQSKNQQGCYQRKKDVGLWLSSFFFLRTLRTFAPFVVCLLSVPPTGLPSTETYLPSEIHSLQLQRLASSEDNCVMEMENKPKGRHKPSKFQAILAAYIFVTCCSSIGLIINSYIKIKEASSTVSDVVDNWQLKPITHITVRTPTGSCPPGYEAYGDGSFLDVKEQSSSGCGCEIGSTYKGETYFSTPSNCNTNQTNADCNNGFKFNAFKFQEYRSSGLCFKRDGEPVLLGKAPKFTSRPEPDPVDFTCPTGYHRCGPSSNDASRSVCMPDTIGTCPMTFSASENTFPTYISGYSSSDPNPLQPTGLDVNNAKLGGNIAAEPFIDGFKSIYSERSDTWKDKTSLLGTLWQEAGLQQQGALPVVEIKLALVEAGNAAPNGICYASGVVGNADRTIMEYSPSGSGQNANFWSLEKCAKPDTRWVQYDTYGLDDFFGNNLRYSTECASLNSSTAISHDYWTNGYTRCADSGTYERCGVSGGASKTCKANDDICKSVYYQSKCGNLAHFRMGLPAGAKVGLYLRHQIYWKSGCGMSKADMKAKIDAAGRSTGGQDNEPDFGTQTDVAEVVTPLNRAVAAALALLIINVVINLYLIFCSALKMALLADDSSFIFQTIALPLARFMFPNSVGDEDQFKIYEEKQTKFDTIAKAAKMVPLIFSVMYIAVVMHYFVNVAEQNCSDSTTNYAFNLLAEALPAAYDSNLATIWMDGLSMAAWIAMHVYSNLYPEKNVKKVIPVNDDNKDKVAIEMGKVPVAQAVVNPPGEDATVIATLIERVENLESGLNVDAAHLANGEISAETVSRIITSLEQKDFGHFKELLTAWFNNEGCHNKAILNNYPAVQNDAKYDTWGWTLAHFAAKYRSEFMEYLTAEPFEIDFDSAANGSASWGAGVTPLMLACAENRTDVVIHLIEKGADYNKTTQKGYNAMDIAKSSGSRAVRNYLHSRGARGTSMCSIS